MRKEKILSEKELEITIIYEGREYTLDEIVYIHNKPRILKDFYNSLVDKYRGLPTISPIHEEEWAKDAAQWLANGEKVAELGCGDGTFAKMVIEIQNNIQEFYLIDFSKEVLSHAKKKLKDCEKCVFKPYNIEKIDTYEGMRKKFDKVISINTIGDTMVEVALNRINHILKKKGEFRATLFAKEYLDEFWEEEMNRTYFSTKLYGYWFTPINFYRGEYKSLGYVKLPNGEKIEFCRIQRCATKKGWENLFEEAGFEVKEIATIKYSKEMVLNRWGKKLTEKQKEFIEKNNGFPECYDIIGIKKNEYKENYMV